MSYDMFFKSLRKHRLLNLNLYLKVSQEIILINRQDNPADTITKVSPNKILEGFLNINKLRVRIEG
jgi:hypothetical protein